MNALQELKFKAQKAGSVGEASGSTQAKPSTSPDGAPTGTAPAVAGAEATTTQSQSIAVTKGKDSPSSTPAKLANKCSPVSKQTIVEAEVRQVDTPSPANGTSGTIVSEGFVFTETQYEPTADVTGEDLSKLSQDDLLTGLKKQFINARKSHGQFGRDLSALVLFYDQVVEHCKIQGVGGEGRKGVPTLQQAFHSVGWNYEAARKMKQRCNASLNALPAYAAGPKPLLLREADLVTEEGKDGVFTVVNVHAPSPANTPAVDIVPEGDDKATPHVITTESLKKVSIKKVEVGNYILCDDNGTEYKYVGQGKFERREKTALIRQKRECEWVEINAKRARAKAETEEKKQQNELRKAEAERRDLKRIEESKVEKEAKAKKKADAETARAKKLAAKAATNSGTRVANATRIVEPPPTPTPEPKLEPTVDKEQAPEIGKKRNTKLLCLKHGLQPVVKSDGSTFALECGCKRPAELPSMAGAESVQEAP